MTVIGTIGMDEHGLQGKLELWSFHFGLWPNLLRPLPVYIVPTKKIEKLERMICIFIRKWLCYKIGSEVALDD